MTKIIIYLIEGRLENDINWIECAFNNKHQALEHCLELKLKYKKNIYEIKEVELFNI